MDLPPGGRDTPLPLGLLEVEEVPLVEEADLGEAARRMAITAPMTCATGPACA
jgi:hypothetical protein